MKPNWEIAMDLEAATSLFWRDANVGSPAFSAEPDIRTRLDVWPGPGRTWQAARIVDGRSVDNISAKSAKAAAREIKRLHDAAKAAQ